MSGSSAPDFPSNDLPSPDKPLAPSVKDGRGSNPNYSISPCPRLPMRLLPAAVTLPILVYLYGPLARFFPALNKDRYARGVVAASNAFFHQRFTAIPFGQRMLFLPYCLRPLDCPTEIDQENGLLCADGCDLPCRLRETRQLALTSGYMDVRIVVSGRIHKRQGMLRSRDFLIRHIERYRPRGVIGCLCTNDLCEKYLHPRNLSPNGTLGGHGLKVIPQVVLLERPNCRQSSVDWTALQALILSSTAPDKPPSL